MGKHTANNRSAEPKLNPERTTELGAAELSDEPISVSEALARLQFRTDGFGPDEQFDLSAVSFNETPSSPTGERSESLRQSEDRTINDELLQGENWVAGLEKIPSAPSANRQRKNTKTKGTGSNKGMHQRRNHHIKW